MSTKEKAGQCPLAARSIASLECTMEDIDNAINIAIQVESSLTVTKGEKTLQQSCSYLLSRILQYIDLMIFYKPFKLFQSGVDVEQALNSAFAHWGISKDENGPQPPVSETKKAEETAFLQEKYAFLFGFN